MKQSMLLLLMCISTGVIRMTSAIQSTALFAGGCFWCMEPIFDKLPGVIDVVSGYTGGTTKNPTYHNYASSGHIEAIRILYDPAITPYTQLLNIFWRNIDPTDPDGQFGDRGKQYQSAIFYLNEKQRQAAEASKKALDLSGKFKKSIATEILPAQPFYQAEDYHQNYYKKNPIRYKLYRSLSGRDSFFKRIWNRTSTNISTTASVYEKPSDSELRKNLTHLQYIVTQNSKTEPPFANSYWNNNQPGIYVDVVSGEPLFSSRDKYTSGSGWPAFTKPLEPGNIIEKEDNTWFNKRIEVRSKHADSHLGHVFQSNTSTGLWYCINSAALRFIPTKDLAKEGYETYANLFD